MRPSRGAEPVTWPRFEGGERYNVALNIVEKIDDLVPVRNVLMSVSDKTGLEDFVPGLLAANPDLTIYSTGGTYTRVREILGAEMAAKNLVSVSDYTGQPEMQGGLVKTLDFKIYLGLLSETYNEAHVRDLERTGGVALDMVVVNLYPFKDTVAKADVTPEMARTNIDIGGPCMIRASAKNFLRVASVTNPDTYGEVLEELSASGGYLGLDMRLKLARQAFAHTADYDAAISQYLASASNEDVQRCYTMV